MSPLKIALVFVGLIFILITLMIIIGVMRIIPLRTGMPIKKIVVVVTTGGITLLLLWYWRLTYVIPLSFFLILITIIGGSIFRAQAYEKKQLWGVQWWQGEKPLLTIRILELVQDIAGLGLLIFFTARAGPDIWEWATTHSIWPWIILPGTLVFLWKFREDVPTVAWVGICLTTGLLAAATLNLLGLNLTPISDLLV